MYPYLSFDKPLHKLDFTYDQVFAFSEEVKQNQSVILKSTGPYTAVHLRLGDQFLETDKHFVQCPHDERRFDPNRMDAAIRTTSGPIVFFCDNQAYKQRIQQTHNVILTIGEIGHTSLSNTTEKQVLDAVTEFYILTQSVHIIAASYSGFSIMASRFHRTPITYLFQNRIDLNQT
jgi:hypothetical protein